MPSNYKKLFRLNKNILSGPVPTFRKVGGGANGIDGFTSLMLHMDGSDGSGTFTDSSLTPVSVTAANAVIDTAESKFGGAAGEFNGINTSLSFADAARFQMGSGDFTIDCWIRPNAVAANYIFFGDFNGAGSAFSIFLQQNTTALLVNVLFTDDSQANITHQTALSNTTWAHVAVVRNGTALNLYLNGVKDNTGYNAGTKTIKGVQSTGNWYIGRAGDISSNYFSGHIDEFRWSKGVARWTDSFTPPTAAYS